MIEELVDGYECIADDAVLLTLRPLKIAGKYVNESEEIFYQYTPLES